MKRRDFIKSTAAASSALFIPATIVGEKAPAGSLVARVTGESPYDITNKAIQLVGGMAKFVGKGDVVMVKPNIGWNRTVEQAACTNPDVLKSIIENVLNTGAKQVIVMDHSCHKAADTYRRSGIEKMGKDLGVDIRHADDNRLVIHDFKGENITRWPVYRDFLEVDKFINVPILKHHGSAGLTIGMKNLYGILGGRRGKLHRNIGAGIADLARGFKTDLTIVDAFRILKRNGPVGGRLSDVELKKTVLASANIFEVDMVSVDVFGETPERFEFIQEGIKRNLGIGDLAKINVKTAAA